MRMCDSRNLACQSEREQMSLQRDGHERAGQSADDHLLESLERDLFELELEEIRDVGCLVWLMEVLSRLVAMFLGVRS